MENLKGMYSKVKENAFLHGMGKTLAISGGATPFVIALQGIITPKFTEMATNLTVSDTVPFALAALALANLAAIPLEALTLSNYGHSGDYASTFAHGWLKNSLAAATLGHGFNIIKTGFNITQFLGFATLLTQGDEGKLLLLNAAGISVATNTISAAANIGILLGFEDRIIKGAHYVKNRMPKIRR